MKRAEFKAKQLWLNFVDATGIVLQIMADTKEKTARWLKKFIKDSRTGYKSFSKKAPKQMTLPYRNDKGRFI
jgi:phage-related protein